MIFYRMLRYCFVCLSVSAIASCSDEPSLPRDTVYRGIDGKVAIKIISSKELELTERGEHFVCEYSRESDRLRVVVEVLGTKRALYFTLIPDGLRDESGIVLYRPERYDQALREVDATRQQTVATSHPSHAADNIAVNRAWTAADDCTKKMLEEIGSRSLTITTAYTSEAPECDRNTYLPPLRDCLGAMQQLKPSIEIRHLQTSSEQVALRDRVQGKFREASEKYKAAIGQVEPTWNNLQAVLQSMQDQVKEQITGGGWLSGFTILASIQNDLRKDQEGIEEVRREVKDLLRGEGIPKYQKANNKIKAANDGFKQHLEQLQTWTKDTNKLVQVLSQPNSEFATKSKQSLAAMDGLLLDLRKSVGDMGSRETPADPVLVVKDYTKAANALAKWLIDENNRVVAFVKENPGLEQHPKWNVVVKVAIFEANMPLHRLLEQCSQQISQNVEALRPVLADPSKVGELELKNVVVQLRQNVTQTDSMLKVWAERLQAVLADAGKIDEKSKQFLAKAVSGDLFAAAVPSTELDSKGTKSIITQLAAIGTKLSELPKVELDEIAEKMKEDNIVVIETDKLVRIVPFDEVWPAASPDTMPSGQGKGKLYRMFDGDRTISSAIKAMMTNKKIATVILVAFESEPSPQTRQVQQPNTGAILLAQLSTVEERLNKANFVVKKWNMGAGDDAKKGPPAPEEGTRPIYLFVPPAETPPMNPIMQPTPPPGFGLEQLKQVKAILADKNARAIFLAVSDATTRRSWDPPAKYVYRDLLREDWGVDVKFQYRVICGVPDPQHSGRFVVDVISWAFTPLNTFTDHPIGEPLKKRRFLVMDACPVIQAETLPKDVKVRPVLEVPPHVNNIWAGTGTNDILGVLAKDRHGGTFERGHDAMKSGFSVIVTSENDKTGSRIVVIGNGLSFNDGYLSRSVPRLDGDLVTIDPPPTENLDLMLNTLYWLLD